MQQTTLDNIIQRLWPLHHAAEKRRVYTILDGARDARITPMVRASRLLHDCLYYEPLTDDLRTAAPHIIELTADADFTRQLLQQGWGQSWGIFLITHAPATLTTVRHNYRKLTLVQDPTGQRLLFRYYDPRVLRTYLPTCTLAEIQTVFGPVKQMIMEGDKANLLHSFKHDEHGSQAEIFEV